MAAIDERRSGRAAIENSTQQCSSTAAPHDRANLRGMAVSSSTAALLLRRSQLPAERLPKHHRKHRRTSQNLAAIRALLYDQIIPSNFEYNLLDKHVKYSNQQMGAVHLGLSNIYFKLMQERFRKAVLYGKGGFNNIHCCGTNVMSQIDAPIHCYETPVVYCQFGINENENALSKSSVSFFNYLRLNSFSFNNKNSKLLSKHINFKSSLCSKLKLKIPIPMLLVFLATFAFKSCCFP